VRIRKSNATGDQYIEGIIAELQALRTEEHRLIHLYSRLRRRPKLRMRFLMDLANLRVRADRLNSSLDPIAQLQDSDAAAQEQLCA
jgi:hypothetical protein